MCTTHAPVTASDMQVYMYMGATSLHSDQVCQKAVSVKVIKELGELGGGGGGRGEGGDESGMLCWRTRDKGWRQLAGVHS